MARHRRHRRQEEASRPASNTPASGFDLSSIANIAGLLNSIDLNQVAGLLSSFNAVNQNNGNMSTENINSSAVVNNETNERSESSTAARKNELANALRVLINADKTELLQVALQFYAANRNNQNNIDDNS